ncbi:hypothetical protein LJ737_13505 [Hymenobacter sp. 15J16-1T3B]|uniref:hypothetical protein n=1 Tax=Hymenobacter sp. 15J16-1T3B TaxID=2886941 RepID=UPI001D1182ED|nr:hypothetical protein [Hymenobacter sp. 15J16-1T3B]MCC3158259.1 hypothetical protein [Hymenobacter sp. 15J16-1T3B]
MAGILNAASQGTYPLAGANWTYFQDQDDSNIFYIVPVPTLAVQSSVPQFRLTEYLDTAKQLISAQCQLTTMLVVPPEVIRGVQAQLKQQGVAAPTYQAMPFIDVVQEGVSPSQATLHYADADGTVSGTVQTTPSLSGSQTAVFNISNMLPSAVNLFKAYFGGDATAGVVEVVYRLTVWARLGAITAQVQFDAQAAYTYQRTFKWVRS